MSEVISEKLGNAKIVVISKTGISHIKAGKENQDSFLYKYDGFGRYAFAVADGVSSCKNAKFGSECACKTVIDLLDEVNGKNEGEIKKMIFKTWKTKVGANWNDFGTTLNFCYVLQGKIILGKVGDGEIILKAENDFYFLSSANEFYTSETFAFGETLSKKAFNLESIKKNSVDSLSLLLMTDGICKEIKQDKKRQFADYLFENTQNKNFLNEVENWLCELDKKNDDDKTILICLMERK